MQATSGAGGYLITNNFKSHRGYVGPVPGYVYNNEGYYERVKNTPGNTTVQPHIPAPVSVAPSPIIPDTVLLNSQGLILRPSHHDSMISSEGGPGAVVMTHSTALDTNSVMNTALVSAGSRLSNNVWSQYVQVKSDFCAHISEDKSLLAPLQTSDEMNSWFSEHFERIKKFVGRPHSSLHEIRKWFRITSPDDFDPRLHVSMWTEHISSKLKRVNAGQKKKASQKTSRSGGFGCRGLNQADDNEDCEQENDLILNHEKGTSGTFRTYTPTLFRRPCFKPHPTEICEPVTMSMISIPRECREKLLLPSKTITHGLLSAPQLESIFTGTQQHNLLNQHTGMRGAFVIGDGTGVGKGRQASGFIVDQWLKGNRRSIWFSCSAMLLQSVKRDLADIGGASIPVFTLRDITKKDDSVEKRDGVLFCTYSLLAQKTKDGAHMNLEKIYHFLDSTFDGLMIIDEFQKTKGCVDTTFDRRCSITSKCMRELQQKYPLSRIVYMSATLISATTEIVNFDRLGLWGPDTAFPTSRDLVEAIQKNGIAGMEMLSMHLKRSGQMCARSISLSEATFEMYSCTFDSGFVELYDEAVQIWSELYYLRERHNYLRERDSHVPRENTSIFWSANQRFFSQMIVASKVSGLIHIVNQYLQQNMSCVISLQTTGESIEPNHFQDEIPSCCRQILLYALEQSKKFLSEKEYADLQNRIEKAKLPANAMDDIVDRFGVDNVAEITGRGKRWVRQGERFALVPRSLSNKEENAAFQSKKKRIAIISDAASTGISLHADKNCANQQKRVMILFQLPWSAEKAVQIIGRVHRSNQQSAPLYVIVRSPIPGEDRFVSGIANRVKAMGALTQADRKACSASKIFDFTNIDQKHAVMAVVEMCKIFSACNSKLPREVQQVSSDFARPSSFVMLQHNLVSPRLTSSLLNHLASKLEMWTLLEKYQLSDQQLQEEKMSNWQVQNDGVKMYFDEKAMVKMKRVRLILKCLFFLGRMGFNYEKIGHRHQHKSEKMLSQFQNKLFSLKIHEQMKVHSFFTFLCEQMALQKVHAGGVVDLLEQNTSVEDKQQIFSCPVSGISTEICKLKIDRGVSFEKALSMLKNNDMALQKMSIPSSASGFYISDNRKMITLVFRNPQNPKTYFHISPHIGKKAGWCDMTNLRDKYTREENLGTIKTLWDRVFDVHKTKCSHHWLHGKTCPPDCTFGKREITSAAISGTILPFWNIVQRYIGDMKLVRLGADNQTGGFLGIMIHRFISKNIDELFSLMKNEIETTAMWENRFALSQNMIVQNPRHEILWYNKAQKSRVHPNGEMDIVHNLNESVQSQVMTSATDGKWVLSVYSSDSLFKRAINLDVVEVYGKEGLDCNSERKVFKQACAANGKCKPACCSYCKRAQARKQTSMISDGVELIGCTLSMRLSCKNLKPGEEYYTTVNYVRDRTVEELKNFVKSRPDTDHVSSVSLLQRELDCNGDQSVMIESLHIHLCDAVTYAKIDTPVRGHECSHFQCFDLMSYIHFAEEYGCYDCQICGKALNPNKLVYSQEFAKLVAQVDEDTTSCEIDRNFLITLQNSTRQNDDHERLFTATKQKYRLKNNSLNVFKNAKDWRSSETNLTAMSSDQKDIVDSGLVELTVEGEALFCTGQNESMCETCEEMQVEFVANEKSSGTNPVFKRHVTQACHAHSSDLHLVSAASQDLQTCDQRSRDGDTGEGKSKRLRLEDTRERIKEKRRKIYEKYMADAK